MVLFFYSLLSFLFGVSRGPSIPHMHLEGAQKFQTKGGWSSTFGGNKPWDRGGQKWNVGAQGNNWNGGAQNSNWSGNAQSSNWGAKRGAAWSQSNDPKRARYCAVSFSLLLNMLSCSLTGKATVAHYNTTILRHSAVFNILLL